MASTTLDIVIKAQDQASKVLRDLRDQLGGVEASTNRLSGANQQAGITVAGLTSSVFKANVAFAAVQLAANLAGDAIHAAFNVGADVLQQASNYQQVSVSFRSMLGSAQQAKTLLKQISDFAARTPFNISDVAEGAKNLLAYGTAADKIIPTFSMLGDIASGVGKDKLPFLINAFGQVQAKGHLAGQELLQFTNTGVGLQQQIQKDLGLTGDQFSKMMEAGKISAQAVTDAFQQMTGPGGLFFNLMAEQSKTFDGTLSNLQDNFTRLGLEIIGISQDGTIRNGSLFQTLTSAAQDLLAWIDRNRTAIESFGRQMLDSVVAIIRNDVVPWLEVMGQKLMQYISSPQFQKDMQSLLTMLQGIGSAIMFLAGATAAVVGFFQAVDRAAQPVANVLNRINELAADLGRLMRSGIGGAVDTVRGIGKSLHIPGFASGTPYAPGGLAMVGERGPELVNLPRGSQVYRNSQTQHMLSNSPTINIGTVINNTQADLGSLARDIGFQLALHT